MIADLADYLPGPEATIVRVGAEEFKYGHVTWN
jgi:hypothetical protein